MSNRNPVTYAALAIACVALALSIRTSTRGRPDAKPPAADACVDAEARAELATLRGALVERDATIARLGRVARATGGDPVADAPPVEPAAPGPPRYTRFEIPNPAVTVTQKDDGSFDVRSTDPALTGTVMTITAVTASGDETKFFIRIP